MSTKKTETKRLTKEVKRCKEVNKIVKPILTAEEKTQRKALRRQAIIGNYINNHLTLNDGTEIKPSIKRDINGNLAIILSIDANAYYWLTQAKNGGIDINYTYKGLKYHGVTSDLRKEQVDNNVSLTETAIREQICKSLTFVELYAIICECHKKDGNARYIIKDSNGKSDNKFFDKYYQN